MDLSALLDEVCVFSDSWPLIQLKYSQISSTRSTWDQRGDALRAIERLMASLCGPTSSPNAFHAFIMLQDTFESNSTSSTRYSTHVELTPPPVASRLVAVLASWLPILQDSLHKLHDSKPLSMLIQRDVARAEYHS